jgi:hypothetical protein
MILATATTEMKEGGQGSSVTPSINLLFVSLPITTRCGSLAPSDSGAGRGGPFRPVFASETPVD